MARSARRSQVLPASPASIPILLGAMVGRQLPFFSLIVPALAHLGLCRLARHDPGLAGDPGLRRLLRHPAIPDFELHQSLDRRHRRIAGLDGVPHRFPEGLAPRGNLDVAGAAHATTNSAATMPPPPAAATEAGDRAKSGPSLVPWIIVCAILLIWGTGGLSSRSIRTLLGTFRPRPPQPDHRKLRRSCRSRRRRQPCSPSPGCPIPAPAC